MANLDGSMGPTHNQRTVLVLDRVDGRADTYRQLLPHHGEWSYQVIAELYDGPILDLCQSQQVDGILLESHHSDSRSFELVQHLKAQLRHQCPPIIMIGENEARGAARAIKLGAIDYLCRDDFTAAQLQQALDAAMPSAHPAAYPRPQDRERFLAVGSDLQAIAGYDGYFRWVSPTFEQVLGWTTAEMTTRPWIDFIHPDDVAPSLATAETLLSGGEIMAFENRYRHRDGTYRWLRWRCQLDVEQQVSYGTAVDISALKQSEAALDNSYDDLVEQSHVFDAMLSAISDFVYLFDRQGRFVFVNQPLLDLWGLPLEDVVGKNFFDLNYPDALAAKHQQEIEQVFTTAQPLRDESSYTSSTGISGVYEYIFTPLFDPEGSVQAVVGSTRDITERQRTAASLQESEERFRLMANTVPEVIWITDAAGRVEFVNQQWKKYTGADSEPTTAVEALISCVHPDDITMTLNTFRQAMESGSLFKAEHRIRSEAGFYHWFLIQAEPYRDPQTGQIVRWFGTLVDIHDRKLAEAALSASEAKYRSLFNSMDEGFCILQLIFDEQDRPIDYRYIETNPVFERQSGLVNALGKTIRELVPNIEPFWFDIYGRVALTGDPMRFEEQAQSMGRWFDVNTFRVGAPHERKVAVLFQDITGAKEAEARLHQAAKLDAFRVTLADALRVLTDPIEVQATACRLIGKELNASRVYYYEYNEATLMGTVHDDYRQDGGPSMVGVYRFDDFSTVHTLLRTGHPLLLADVANTTMLTPAEQARFEVLGIDALVCIPLVKNYQLVAVFSVAQSTPRNWTALEISLIHETAERTWAAVERAQAEARLSQSEAQFRLLVTASSDTLYKMSADWSEMYSLYGQGFLSSTDHPNRLWLDAYIPQDEQPPVLEAIQQAICDKRPFELEHQVWRADGTVGWTVSRAVPLLNEQNEIVEWFGAASDVTERKQLLEREQTARENAERANRTKDEFLAILSHELRSPLNPILGWAKLLQTNQLDADKTQRALATIERNAKLQTQLIDDLLDVAKILRGKLEISDIAIDLATVIEASIDVVRTAVQAKAIALHISLADNCLVRGDSARLQQVIWNLLSNAVKFTPQGGQIELSLTSVDDCAQVTITDTGKGISREFLPQLFDSFRQEDVSITRQYGGLGLGLSIVKYLVEAHGGSIVADSPGEGQGSTFTLRLPLMPDAAVPPLKEARLPTVIDLTGVKVLAVDDSQDSLDLIAMVLSQYGAEVRAVASAHEVLPHLTNFEPDVLVCDIAMPDMDGYTLLQQIRHLSPEYGSQVPAIAVTAFAREEDRHRALANGFQQHMSKPIEPEKLLLAVIELTMAGRTADCGPLK
ncbi:MULTISPECIES: PAS domain S-box protein [Cyanophyceae]|uniref:PAS domain S-box protein n=1 Tax=Cyanophyceae TaxID=3028117 RepID=UPI0016850368|nr:MULTISPECIES: PAS domain S-box protein [Cyanophyceae]MBD1914723.1 PAS domain S-box protein [Phormidium sp. FACHB-77]MBD2030826.1 PAS domain S-box protein [Phormidium sp. FACHB-322]MBD2052425.1 PAS domain S-box protein [Leptolyngbya sp. FACHB-60]